MHASSTCAPTCPQMSASAQMPTAMILTPSTCRHAWDTVCMGYRMHVKGIYSFPKLLHTRNTLNLSPSPSHARAWPPDWVGSSSAMPFPLA